MINISIVTFICICVISFVTGGLVGVGVACHYIMKGEED